MFNLLQDSSFGKQLYSSHCLHLRREKCEVIEDWLDLNFDKNWQTQYSRRMIHINIFSVCYIVYSYFYVILAWRLECFQYVVIRFLMV